MMKYQIKNQNLKEKKELLEKNRRIKFWMDSMLVHQRTDSASYAAKQAGAALKYFNEMIKNGEFE